jgi:hypothetical protein
MSVKRIAGIVMLLGLVGVVVFLLRERRTPASGLRPVETPRQGQTEAPLLVAALSSARPRVAAARPEGERPSGARLVSGVATTADPLAVEARFVTSTPVARPADDRFKPLAMPRAALEDSIPLRERQLEEARREEVVASVTQRAASLGIAVPVEALTDLLYQAARLELRVDRCRLAQPAAECTQLQNEQHAVEERFQALAGRSIDEFRTGQPKRETPTFEGGDAAP